MMAFSGLYMVCCMYHMLKLSVSVRLLYVIVMELSKTKIVFT